MKNYHNSYLKCDVLLLVDVFDKFRNSSLKRCELYPSQYLRVGDLSWNPVINATKVELELI